VKERDWQADWNFINGLPDLLWSACVESSWVKEFGRYWLQRAGELERRLGEALLNVQANERLWLEAEKEARELEEENRRLRAAVKAGQKLMRYLVGYCS